MIDLLSRGVDRIKGKMQVLASANKDVQRSFDSMQQSARGAAMMGVVTAAAARGLRPAVNAAGDLQAEMLGTRAELDGAVKESRDLEMQLKRIKATAFTVQAWTPYDMGQIVALEKQLLKAGAKVDAVVGEKGAAAAAAALGVYEDLDPAETGKKLIGIATPFKLQANQFMDLADKISRAASASTVGASEIAETAKYAAPAMSELGQSVDEMLTLSAMLAQRGIESSMAGTGLRQFFNSAAKSKAFRDAAGNLKPLAEITAILKRNLDGLGEAEKQARLTKLFDVRGAVVAQALLDDGAASYEQIAAAMARSLSLQEKLEIKMRGFEAQLESLRGTSKSTIADLYQSALPPLTWVISKTNELIALIGQASQENEGLGKLVSGASFATLAGGAAATTMLAGAAVLYGRKVLSGLGGWKGLLGSATSASAGIAAGKAVEKATGVTPVFVTNWPPGGLGAGPGGAVETAAAVAGAGWLKKMAGKAGVLAKAAPLLLGKTGLVGAAGTAGYGVGTGLNHGFGWLAGKMSGGKYDGGGWLGEMLYDLLHREERQPTQNNINIQIDRQGRAFVETDNSQRNRVALMRGDF